MGYTSEELELACNFCERARQNRNDYWYCSARQDDFPSADWSEDEENESECDYFEYNGGYRNT